MNDKLIDYDHHVARPIYERVAKEVHEWRQKREERTGAVTTADELIERIKKHHPHYSLQLVGWIYNRVEEMAEPTQQL